MEIKCFLGFHNFNQWYYHMDETKVPDNIIINKYLIQRFRSCVRCGNTELLADGGGDRRFVKTDCLILVRPEAGLSNALFADVKYPKKEEINYLTETTLEDWFQEYLWNL